jgi:hypothetical protein
MSPRVLSNKAEEYVPINQRPPIPRRIIRNNLNNNKLNILRRNLTIKSNLNKIKRNVSVKSANNARNNYKKKMANYMRVRSAAIPMENIERNLTRPRRKTRKGRK